MQTKFAGISVHHWRQFRSVEIEFGDRMTILTGRNGTGKTTILNLLAKHGKYSSPLLGSPVQARDQFGRYTSGIWQTDIDQSSQNIGNIRYLNGENAEILVPKAGSVGFQPVISNQQVVSVLNIGSHRRLPKYKAVETIPTSPVTSAKALDVYQSEFWADISRIPPLTRMKESLISMAVFGRGNEIVTANDEAYAIFEDFQNRLRQIVPSNIGFKRLTVNVPDVIVETESGNFLIDASSGGLMSLIDIAWEITLFSRSGTAAVIIIDEPENHLHPSMQREFLPALAEAFPDAQFIVATHSPFMVNSIRDAKVYAFDVDYSSRNDEHVAEDLSGAKNAVVTVPVSLSDRTSADEVMRKILGVPVTVPIWAEKALSSVATEFAGQKMSAESIEAIRSQLVSLGLEEFLPQAVAEAALKNAAAN